MHFYARVSCKLLSEKSRDDIVLQAGKLTNLLYNLCSVGSGSKHFVHIIANFMFNVKKMRYKYT
jgi:hypothetical protein